MLILYYIVIYVFYIKYFREVVGEKTTSFAHVTSFKLGSEVLYTLSIHLSSIMDVVDYINQPIWAYEITNWAILFGLLALGLSYFGIKFNIWISRA
ncbi:hypothetical protein L1987_51553 [Smallanthus sonchifolius]|uniref:Uncharacterized protein n=1 Tax=Smallanthus sonchifolius TaxID=185202 RepID=A0ACB9EQQ4_9ASTR|nr:hypothetical protein L1987_51553 [Smallanthus sonchifolius]